MALKPIDELGALSQAKREQILTAARQLFLELGFERTSMEEIRKAAGVSKPTLYNHYQGKEGLFADVLSEIVDEIGGDWLPSVEMAAMPLHSQTALRDTLASLAHQAVAGLMRPEYLAMVRVVVAEAPRFPQLGEIFRAAGPERGFRAVATLLEHARAAGVANVADPELAARMFLGPILSYVLSDGLLIPKESHPPSPERIDGMVGMFMKVIS